MLTSTPKARTDCAMQNQKLPCVQILIYHSQSLFLIFRPGKSYLSFLGIRHSIGKLRPGILLHIGTAHNSNSNCDFKQPLF